MHNAVGINGSPAERQDLDIRLAELAVQRMELAVDVADANVIQIDESQLANAGPRQGFDRPGANPAEANNAYMGAPTPLKPFLSEQAANAAEAPFIVVHDGQFSTKTGTICQAVTGASLAVKFLRQNWLGNAIGCVPA